MKSDVLPAGTLNYGHFTIRATTPLLRRGQVLETSTKRTKQIETKRWPSSSQQLYRPRGSEKFTLPITQ